MKNTTYQQQRDIHATQQLRKLRQNLPPICNAFFVGIEPRTSALTRLGYAQDLRVFFHFLLTEIVEFVDISPYAFDYNHLSAVTANHIEMFLEYLSHYELDGVEHSNTLKTKARKLASVKSFFKYCYNRDYIPSDPASKVATPKLHTKAIIRLENDEVEQLLDCVDNGNGLHGKQKSYHERTKVRDQAILTLFLGTGIRISELVGLNVDDIDFSTRAFRIVRKGGNETVLYFSEEVARALLEWLDTRAANEKLDHEPALFVSLQNKRICARAVENLVKKYAQISAPLKHITPHKLRSTYGTQLYRQTHDIYVVAEVLGHSDINTTKKHYAAMSEETKRAAAQQVVLRKTELSDNPEQSDEES